MATKHNCEELQATDESYKGGTMMFFCSMLGVCPYATHPSVTCLLNHDTSGYRKVTESDIMALIASSSKN